MKTRHLIIYALTLCILLSCSDNKDKEEEDVPIGELSVYIGNRLEKDFETKLFFTVNDIKTFNLTTSEIAFKSFSYEEIDAQLDLVSILTFYFDDRILFDSVAVCPIISSATFDDLVFVQRIDSAYYLYTHGYPPLEKLDNREKREQIRKEYFEKRRKYWESFIKYLREQGKLIE